MKSYLLKLSGQEEGPFSEGQVAQMFADQRVNRDTPCKLATGTEWKAIDDYMPMLKYGTQLPPATSQTAAPANVSTPPIPATTTAPAIQQVAVVDFDIPFGSLLKLMFKLMAAGLVVFCCYIPVIILIWVIVMAILATFLGGVMSNFRHP